MLVGILIGRLPGRRREVTTMIDNFVRDPQALRQADFIIGKIWLNIAIRRMGLFAFATLIGIFDLRMANIAGHNALQQAIGAVWADAMAIWILRSRGSCWRQPNPARNRKWVSPWNSAEWHRNPFERTRATSSSRSTRLAMRLIADFMHNPLDVATEQLLIPAAGPLLKGLSSKKEQAG